jgi:hypothetical protein
MLYRAIIAVCSQIHTKHINTVWQSLQLLNVKLVDASRNQKVKRTSRSQYSLPRPNKTNSLLPLWLTHTPQPSNCTIVFHSLNTTGTQQLVLTSSSSFLVASTDVLLRIITAFPRPTAQKPDTVLQIRPRPASLYKHFPSRL